MTHSVRTDTYANRLDGRRGWRDTASHYALLPLRVFLGVTFLYAGLNKLTDGTFLRSSGAGSSARRCARPATPPPSPP